MDRGSKTEYRWLPNGQVALDEMLAAIDAAKSSIRMETYIFHPSSTAEQFLRALISACQRGVKARVLADGLGSFSLSDSYWAEFRAAGGQFRWFNPIGVRSMAIRDHRKITVCDEELAFIGGFNISSVYQGDGVQSGWRDLGLRLRGPLVPGLVKAFDEMFECADFKHKPFSRLRLSQRQKTVQAPEARLLLGAPGRNNAIKRSLRLDLRDARDVRIICAYFLPPWRMRRDLTRVARRGGKVTLILPMKTDVPMSRLAAQSFYRRLLIAGVEIYEYEPQILHAKLFLFDDVVYVGSANFDLRSLNLNYEICVRLSNPDLAREARQIFDRDLTFCQKIEYESWRKSRNLWERIKGRIAYWFLARIDPYIALRQLE